MAVVPAKGLGYVGQGGAVPGSFLDMLLPFYSAQTATRTSQINVHQSPWPALYPALRSDVLHAGDV